MHPCDLIDRPSDIKYKPEVFVKNSYPPIACVGPNPTHTIQNIGGQLYDIKIKPHTNKPKIKKEDIRAQLIDDYRWVRSTIYRTFQTIDLNLKYWELNYNNEKNNKKNDADESDESDELDDKRNDEKDESDELNTGWPGYPKPKD